MNISLKCAELCDLFTKIGSYTNGYAPLVLEFEFYMLQREKIEF